jgi:hypothetical protein
MPPGKDDWNFLVRTLKKSGKLTILSVFLKKEKVPLLTSSLCVAVKEHYSMDFIYIVYFITVYSPAGVQFATVLSLDAVIFISRSQSSIQMP